MAQIRLRLDEAPHSLPFVCIRCGGPACAWLSLPITWVPPWTYWLLLAGVVPYFVVSPLVTKNVALHAPFCQRHLNHWSRRETVIVMSLFAFVPAFVSSVTLIVLYPALPLLWILPPSCFVTLLGAVVVARRATVRPVEVTDIHIVIDGVCVEFVEAVRRSDQARDDFTFGAGNVVEPKVPIEPSEAIQTDRPQLPPSGAIQESSGDL